MKLLFIALATLAFTSSGVHASEKLAQSSGCTACHGTDKRIIGPSFKEIAAKYRGSKDAQALLVKKVKAGGVGVWGKVAMPPNPHIKDQDIAAVVQWALQLK